MLTLSVQHEKNKNPISVYITWAQYEDKFRAARCTWSTLLAGDTIKRRPRALVTCIVEKSSLVDTGAYTIKKRRCVNNINRSLHVIVLDQGQGTLNPINLQRRHHQEQSITTHKITQEAGTDYVNHLYGQNILTCTTPEKFLIGSGFINFLINTQARASHQRHEDYSLMSSHKYPVKTWNLISS